MLFNNESDLIDTVRSFSGGAGVTIIGAALGRIMWHIGEVRKQNRKFFSIELLWEIPIALGMGFFGEAAANWMGANDHVQIGVIIMLSYLGPRGVEAFFTRWLSKK